MPKDHLIPDEYVGAILLRSRWMFFTAFMFYWKLDFVTSNPNDEASNFRGGIMKVDETNADEFIRVMQEYALSESELRHLIAKEGVEEAYLMFVVDFDNRTYVSAYFDYPFEEYAPPGWKSSYGSTLDYVPEHIRALWTEAGAES